MEEERGSRGREREVMRRSEANNGTVARFVVRRSSEDKSTKTRMGEKDGLRLLVLCEVRRRVFICETETSTLRVRREEGREKR